MSAQACADLPLHVILKILSQMNNPNIGTLLTTFKGLKLKQDLKIDLTKIETTVNEYFKQLNSEEINNILKTHNYSNIFYLIITFNQALYIIRCRFGISKNIDVPNYNVYFRPKINTYFSIDTIPIDNIDNITNITKLLELIKNNILFNIYQTIYNKKPSDPKVLINFRSVPALPDNEVLLIADPDHSKSIPENILKKIPDISADYNSMAQTLKTILFKDSGNNNVIQEKRDLKKRGLNINNSTIKLNNDNNTAKLNAIYGYAKEYCKSIINNPDKINIINDFENKPMYFLKFIANNFITTGVPATMWNELNALQANLKIARQSKNAENIATAEAAAQGVIDQVNIITFPDIITSIDDKLKYLKNLAEEEGKYINFFNELIVTYQDQLLWFANELFQYYDNETKKQNKGKGFFDPNKIPDKDIIVFSKSASGGKKKPTKKTTQKTTNKTTNKTTQKTTQKSIKKFDM